MKEYIDSLTKPGDFLSGNPELLPKDLNEKFTQFKALEEAYFTGERFQRKDQKASYTEALNSARKEYYSELLQACETYLKNQDITNQKHSDMSSKTTKTAEETAEQTKKREPQLITINGDKITHAHAFKSNQNDDWFFTAKINDMPMKAQLINKNDVEWVFDKSVSVKEKIEKYYPTVLMPKVNPAEFKLPRTFTTGNGEEQLLKFNVYKENDPQNVSYGKYRFYAQVGDKKMSCEASKNDLDAYFNRVATPVQLITKNFGDRLSMRAHYEQFKLPEEFGLEAKDIRIAKNQQTNRYEISVNVKDRYQTQAKELSYDDRQSYFQHKVATKEQLAAKYLSQEIESLSKTSKQALEKQLGMSR